MLPASCCAVADDRFVVGVEISSEIADGSQSLILDQVTNGVAVRMAVLYLLAGGNFEKEDEAPPVKKPKRERKAPQQ